MEGDEVQQSVSSAENPLKYNFKENAKVYPEMQVSPDGLLPKDAQVSPQLIADFLDYFPSANDQLMRENFEENYWVRNKVFEFNGRSYVYSGSQIGA